MPPSIGPSHLRLKAQPRHTYEQRLRAMTHVEEEERRALSSMWRNSGRVVPHRPSEGNTEGPHTVGLEIDAHQKNDPILAKYSSLVPQLNVSPTQSPRGINPFKRQPQLPHVVDVSADAPEQGRYLSPEHIRVRGLKSYVEDPQETKRLNNEYIAYFRSNLHDKEIVESLLPRVNPKKKKSVASELQQSTRRSTASQPQNAQLRTSRPLSNEQSMTDTMTSLDDLGFAPNRTARQPNGRHSEAGQGRQSHSRGEHDEAMYSNHNFDEGEGGDPNFPSNDPRSFHHIDRQRLKMHKPKYSDLGPVDVTTLKPKSAVMHVKYEKLWRRMKAEDDEFVAFRKEYLGTMRKVFV